MTPAYLSQSLAYRMLSTPWAIRGSIRMILATATLIILAVVFIPWQQTAVGDGRVIAFDPAERLQIITANLDGNIEKWFVREGDRVKKGDVVARMADNDPDIVARLRKEREALAVVPIVFAFLAIEFGTIEVIVLLHEKDRYIGAWQHTAEQPPADDLVAERHVERPPRAEAEGRDAIAAGRDLARQQTRRGRLRRRQPGR